jgi:hypothetical protein
MRTEVKYALGFAALGVGYVLFEHVMGFMTERHDIGQYTRLGSAVFPTLAIALGLRARRRQLGGTITFRQGFETGALITVSFAAVMACFYVLYGTLINPQFVPTYLEYERVRMLAAGASAEEIQEKAAEITTFLSLPVLPLMQFGMTTVFGLVVSAIASVVLSRKRAKS